MGTNNTLTLIDGHQVPLNTFNSKIKLKKVTLIYNMAM